MTTAGVVLAAGAGTRFDGPEHKLRAVFGDRTVIEAAVAPAVEAGLDEVIVVVGDVDLLDLLPPGVTVVENPEFESGMATSLRVACDVADRAGHDNIVVALGDQPLLLASAWAAVAAAPDPIAVAVYDGVRSHPVKIRRMLWGELPVRGDGGARALMALRPELVGEVACQGQPDDVDTRDDLADLDR